METKEKKQPTRERNRSRSRAQQDVVYTQAKPFNRKRFLLRLATVAAVVLALLFGLSIFFQVDYDKIEVSGAEKYSAATVVESSGITDGENLITLSKARVGSNILATLPYVNTVRVGIRLPDTVVIQIEELEVAYAAQDQNGSWWLLNTQGRVVDTCKAADAEDYTQILGVQLAAPAVGADAVAYEPLPEPDESGATIPVTVYASERLQAAISIIGYLEEVELIGTVSSVDVSKLGDIELWYGTRFQMLLGDTNNLHKKVDALAQTVKQLDEYDTGVLDASFTYWSDQVGYSQFD